MRTISWSYLRSLELEGRHPSDAGLWKITALRLSTGEGTPSNDGPRSQVQVNDDAPLPPAPALPHSVRRSPRWYCYKRIRTIAEAERFLDHFPIVGVSLKTFPSWADPPNGEIPTPKDDDVPFGENHQVAIIGYDAKLRQFRFKNWWSDWGNAGSGSFSYDYFDRYVFEAWGSYLSPREETRREKTGAGFKEVRWAIRDESNSHIYGFEINNKSATDRWAWAFVVERDGALEIEEIYVRPEHRRRGYATRLAHGIRELAKAKRLPLRLWVPFADCRQESPNNYAALIALAEQLSLRYQPCPVRWAAYYATNDPQGSEAPIEPLIIPKRPRCSRKDIQEAACATTPWQYTVWYATNRVVIGAAAGLLGFSGDRGTDVHYGKCVVTIPKSHRLGSIGSSFFARCLRGTDDRLNVDRLVPLPEEAFWNEIRRILDQQPNDDRQSLVYLHGFNISFEQAAARAAQIGFDLKVPGVTAFFSWPSKANVFQYPADEATIEASEGAIADFLERFAADSGSEQVHLIAHSMGNRGLLRALQRITSRAEQAAHVRFGQIFVMAPDIDCELFLNLADAFRCTARRTTLYASPGDRAVGLSAFLHDYPRAGFIPPVTIAPGIDTIEVPTFNLLELGHGYYAEASPVLHDMFDLIRNDASPKNRQRLIKMSSGSGETYWRMME